MDYLKLQNDILKNYNNSNIFYGRKPFDFLGEKLDSGYLITDGHFVVIVPEIFFFLDFDKIFTKNNKTCRLSSCVFDRSYEFETILPEYKKTISAMGKDIEIQVFSFMDSEKDKISVDTKLLKYFSGDLHFSGYKYNCPIHIFDGDIYCGVVLPLNHKE